MQLLGINFSAIVPVYFKILNWDIARACVPFFLLRVFLANESSFFALRITPKQLNVESWNFQCRYPPKLTVCQILGRQVTWRRFYYDRKLTFKLCTSITAKRLRKNVLNVCSLVVHHDTISFGHLTHQIGRSLFILISFLFLFFFFLSFDQSLVPRTPPRPLNVEIW